MTGRKPYTPTDEQRRVVIAMASFGVPHDDIALVVRCSPPTLRKWFRHELDVAVIEANARVAQTLFAQAVKPGNIAASIFWLKARAGWREKHAVEVSGPGGTEPLTVVVRRMGPPSSEPGPSLIEGKAE